MDSQLPSPPPSARRFADRILAEALSLAEASSGEARFAFDAATAIKWLGLEEFAVHSGASARRTTSALGPTKAQAWLLHPGASTRWRGLRVRLAAGVHTGGIVHQIVRLGPQGQLVDLQRTDRFEIERTIDAGDLGAILVVSAARTSGVDVTLQVDEVASEGELCVSRANCRAGTSYEVDPIDFAWTWISPDVMVDNDDDLLADDVLMGSANRLKVRLRNRGAAVQAGVDARFYYQLGSLAPNESSWVPVTNTAGIPQALTGLSLPPRSEAWHAVSWTPPIDNSVATSYSLKVEVSTPSSSGRSTTVIITRIGRIRPETDPDVIDLMPHDAIPIDPSDIVTVSHGGWTITPTTSTTGGATSSSALTSSGTRVRRFEVRRARGLRLGLGDTRPDPERYYALDPRTLPPGVTPSDLVSVLALRDGEPIAGTSLWLGEPRR